MMKINKPTVRHTMQAELLRQALIGNITGINTVLNYLSSANPTLRQIMQETIYDHSDPWLWEKLLHCLALHRWDEHLDCYRRSDPVASKRIDDSITEVFLEDESEADKEMKTVVLLSGLDFADSQVSQTAAFLLGLRGDTCAIPVLSKTIKCDSSKWQLRAIRALDTIGDENCGPPLLEALITGRGEVHREAGRALNHLGKSAESTWLKALTHPDQHIRWHAARGLGNIGDVSYAHMLADGLFDENQHVRWATADVLARLGTPAVPATLKIISQSKLDVPARQAAYHALHGITSRKTQARLRPLLDAFHGPAASIEIPIIAQRLLQEWEKNG